MVYFIYETTNLINNKKYRGLHRTENIDDNYLGSGIAIKKAIKKHGKENFKREILEYCNSLEELLKLEEKYVNEEWVKCQDTYNMRLGGICSIGRLTPLDEESKKKISDTLKKGYASGRIIPPKPNLGKIMSDKLKEKISKTLKEKYAIGEIISPNIGKESPMKGKKTGKPSYNKGTTGLYQHSEEAKEKISKYLLEKYANQEHHLKGKEPWNKGKTGIQEAWNKGKKLEQFECPHCGKMADKSNLKRWHLERCRSLENII